MVISFHSLEDRIVKRFMQAPARPQQDADPALRRAPLRAADLPQPTLKLLGRFKPGADEVADNPRARSAVMRVAEKAAGGPPGMNRLTFFLLAALLLCALSLVSAQHQARTLFVALERAQSEEKQLDIDWSRLQYQQSALGKTRALPMPRAPAQDGAGAGRPYPVPAGRGAAQHAA